MDEAEAAGGEGGVAAALLLARLLQHEHPRALFARGERRAQRRIAGADHDDVVLARCSASPGPSPLRCIRSAGRGPAVIFALRRRNASHVNARVNTVCIDADMC